MIIYTNRYRDPFEIDEDDFEIVSRYSWRLAATYIQTTIGRKTLCLHMLLLGKAPEGLMWDHEDRNKMNNRRSNLRAVTPSENGKNKDISCRLKPGISGIEGIQKNRNKWVVYIPPTMLNPGQQVLVGRFSNLSDAIHAQISAIKQL